MRASDNRRFFRRNHTIRIFAFHLLCQGGILLFTTVLFVIADAPEPVAVGIQTVLLSLVQGIAGIMMALHHTSNRTRVLWHLAAFLLSLALRILIDPIYSDLLWTLRPQNSI